MKKKEESNAKQSFVVTKKVAIVPIGDKEKVKETYQYIRDAMYAQYKASNLYMGQITASFYKNGGDFKNPNYLAEKREIVSANNPLMQQIKFPTGLDLRSAVIQKVDQDLRSSIKNGLARGDRSITNYKRESPIPTQGRNIKFEFEFNKETLQEFNDDPTNKKVENELLRSMSVIFKWVNKKSFTLVFGNPARSLELRKTFFKIYTGECGYCASKIMIDGKKIFLLLSVEMPIQSRELNEDTVVGVDLGFKNPVVCALNNDIYPREYIGTIDEFLRVRTRLQDQRRKLQKSLDFSKAQHGRKKKLQALNRLNKREMSFAKTFNHVASRKVVDFALKHRAKYINMENLEGYGDNPKNKFFLRNWSYYSLQEMIIYKAKEYGIKVRKVNPYNTSQYCSFCGCEAEGQLIDRNTFVCKNPDCISHSFRSNYVESDFNAARNIAKSTEWSKGKKSFDESKEMHEAETEAETVISVTIED